MPDARRAEPLLTTGWLPLPGSAFAVLVLGRHGTSGKGPAATTPPSAADEGRDADTEIVVLLDETVAAERDVPGGIPTIVPDAEEAVARPRRGDRSNRRRARRSAEGGRR